MKKAFVAILSLVALVGCSQDSIVETSDSGLINFDNLFVENKTRAADPSTTTANINEFAVWGFRGDAQELVFNNERVYKNEDGAWTYDHLQYWMEGKNYYFYAVSPVNHKDVTVNTETMSKDGLGTISFTNEDGSVDLIYASQVVRAEDINPSAPEKVSLQFAHLLSRVKFSFKYNFPNELTTVAVKNIKINNSPAKGSIDVTEARANWSWNIPQSGETMVADFGNANAGAEFAEMNVYYDSDKYRLVIPTDETRGHNITFDVVVYNNHVESYTYSISTTLEDKAFVQGKSYNIVTKITPDNLVDGGLKPIEFDVIEVEEWIDENVELINPDQPGDDNDDPEAFEPVASEWGVVGDLTSWGNDIVMYTTPTENLFVAEKVEIASGTFKIRANKEWNDAKNYGFEVAGQAYADKYYAVITGGGSQNIAPIEYGTYDVYFDLANKRVALMTPGKAYAEAVDGGAPVVVVAGLKDHEWGLVGSFNGWDVANYVITVVEGDWAVAKGVALDNGAEFKFAADKAWTLSYGTGSDVVAGQTYTTFNNGGNMKFTGESGTYDVYFSLVNADFYMTAAATEPVEPEEPAVTYTTVAEFLAAEVDESETAPMYTLKGTITAVANTSYGNFDLTDDTGTVYIYGLMSPDGATNKYWATSGAKLGDDIVIKTVRTSFNGTAQGKNAWFVELVSPGTRAFYTVDPAAVDFASAGGEQDIEVFAYNTSAAVTATSDNAAFTVDVNGYVVTVTAAANELEEAVTGNITIKVGDLEPTVVKATLAAKPASGVLEGGSDDFHTISATNTSYVTGKTTAGWSYKNCAIFKGGTSDSSPAFKMIGDANNRALCMNGKTSAVGSITSPTLTTGCGTLKFNYGLPFSDTMIKFRVDIIQDGAVVKTFTVDKSSAAKYTLYSHEEVINVAGDFQIVFTNLSPSNSTSNKDRTAIWDVEWTGYNN